MAHEVGKYRCGFYAPEQRSQGFPARQLIHSLHVFPDMIVISITQLVLPVPPKGVVFPVSDLIIT